MAIQAALFDLDDTLYNRDQAFERFVHRFVGDFSSALVDGSSRLLSEMLFQLDCHGYKPRREMFTEIMNRFSWKTLPSLDQLIDYYCAEFPKCVAAGPELAKTLDWCMENHIKTGIITNGPVDMQNTKVDILRIRKYISTVVTSEETGIRKPDPQIFYLALERMNVDKQSALYVGDNPSVDVKGANDAGLVSVWLSHGRIWEIEEYKPVVTIECLTDLMGIELG